MTAAVAIYLASRSPRRRQLLAQIGVRHETLPATVDESPLTAESPDDYVTRLALAKARAGWSRLGKRPRRPVLGADTAVILDRMILGKPKQESDGLRMLAMLSGREHRVLSAVALVLGEREDIRLQISRVRFRALSPRECSAYWRTGEPADKAGGYGIQGYAATFIENIEGSYSGIMGLPLFETAELLRSFGLHLLPED